MRRQSQLLASTSPAVIDISLAYLVRRGGLGRDRLAERVEVDDDNVDGRDVVLLNGLRVGLQVATSKDAAMHTGVQRFHTACKERTRVSVLQWKDTAWTKRGPPTMCNAPSSISGKPVSSSTR